MAAGGAGFWSDRFWHDNYWHLDYWSEGGATSPPVVPTVSVQFNLEANTGHLFSFNVPRVVTFNLEVV